MSAIGRWKIIAALFVLCCIALAYRVFDQGISRTYLEASQETSVAYLKLLTGLVGHEWLGLTKEQVMVRLKAYVASQPPGSVVLKAYPEADDIYLEGVHFEFADGKLKSVTTQ